MQNNSNKIQHQRVISALRNSAEIGLTTIQLREDYDIMMPAARIHELRWEEGYNIQSIRVKDQNAQGNTHRCGRYILLSGKWEAAARGLNNEH